MWPVGKSGGWGARRARALWGIKEGMEWLAAPARAMQTARAVFVARAKKRAGMVATESGGEHSGERPALEKGAYLQPWRGRDSLGGRSRQSAGDAEIS